MNDTLLNNSLHSSSISSAPSRPQKLGNVQSIVKDQRDKDINMPSPFEEITLSDDDETSAKPIKCSTCSKDMSIWTTYRRDIHTKVCKAKRAEKGKKLDRKSGKLTETLETDDKILDNRVQECREPCKSWEISRNNVKFSRIAADDEENRKRKRPRSFAVVELAPKKCQCEVLTTLHARFIDEFHCNSVQFKNKQESSVTEHSYQMKKMLGKLSRFEQLSADMRKVYEDTSESSSFFVTFHCSDGYKIKTQALILKHRTSAIKMHPAVETIEVQHSKEVLKAWLTFVFTANIEWSSMEELGIGDLARTYGPVGLKYLLDENKNDKTDVKDINKLKAGSESVHEEGPLSSKVHFDHDIEELMHKEATVQYEAPIKQDGSINYFTSEDPFMGFGKTDDIEELVDDQEVSIESLSRKSEVSTPRQSRENVTMDSFDEWSKQPNSSFPRTCSPVTIVTPVRSATKLMFGSHVKILKTDDITPMPPFETMDESELKGLMKEIGMRPKGKKAMIQILKRAYTTLHPEVCMGTPTIRPLLKTGSTDNVSDIRRRTGNMGRAETEKPTTLFERMAASPKKNIAKKTAPMKSSDSVEEILDDSDADKTLNISNDEREAGKICGDDIGEDEDEEEVSTASGGKADLNSLKISFLTWIRNDQNTVLHEHILSLQPVSLEEMLIRLEKADGPLGRIGKGKLVNLLDMMKITYQLPQKTGRARGGFKRRL